MTPDITLNGAVVLVAVLGLVLGAYCIDVFMNRRVR